MHSSATHGGLFVPKEKEETRGADIAWAWMFGLLEVLLASAIVLWLLTLPPVFQAYYSRLKVSPHLQDAQTIVNWLATSQPGQPLDPTLAEGVLRPKELSHFADVRELFAWFPRIAAILAIISLASLCAVRPTRKLLLAAQARGMVFWTVLVCFAAGLALWDWETFFAWVHYPFFGRTSWRLPRSAYSLRLFPSSFWRLLAGAVLLAPLILLSAATAVLILTGSRTARTREGWLRPARGRTLMK
jgi:hypothetical protein